MKPAMRPAFAALFVTLSMVVTIAAATAEDAPAPRPKTTPTRDVDVLYTITRAGQMMQERTRWSVADGTQRVDPPDRNLHLVMDHKQHRAWLIDDDNHSVMDMAPPRLGPLDPASPATFTRRGEAVVAGLGCTEWETKSGGPVTTLCLTDDGVLLRVQAEGHTLIEANTVSYGPAEAALFQIPAEYRHLAPPAARPRPMRAPPGGDAPTAPPAAAAIAPPTTPPAARPADPSAPPPQ